MMNLDGESQSFTIESNNYLGINTEGYSSFWVADMNSNGDLELYAGQDLGGMSVGSDKPGGAEMHL